MLSTIKNNATVFRAMTGLFFLLLIPIWILAIGPRLIQIPHDLNHVVQVSSFDNFYDEELGEYVGEKPSSTKLRYVSLVQGDGIISVRNSFDVQSLLGDPVFSVSRAYAVDPISGMHIPGSESNRNGYLFAPRMMGLLAQADNKSSFEYWHPNYDTPITMAYADTVSQFGFAVYRYESKFSADQTGDLAGKLPGVGQDKGVVLDGQISLWIEPHTGRILRYSDSAEAYFYDLATGKRTHPWNKFRNSTATVSAAEQAQSISLLKQKVFLVSVIVPSAFFVLAVFLLFYGTISRRVRKILYWIASFGKTWLLPALSGLIVLGFACLLAFVSYKIIDNQKKTHFESEINKTNEMITTRLGQYANVLRGGRGMFDASDVVDRDEWKKYRDSLNIESYYPGMRGFGFAKAVRAGEEDEFIESVQEEGFPKFRINPIGERDFYAPVLFFEPFNSEENGAFGFDKFSNPVRRSALEFARDSGGAALSGKVILVGPGKHPGFLMYEPVFSYRPKDVAERRDALYGFVFGSFRVQNFMDSIFLQEGTTLGIRVFDDAHANGDSVENLMFENNIVKSNPKYKKISSIYAYNRIWTIEYTAGREFSADSVRDSVPVIILISGLSLAILIFVIVHMASLRRVQFLASGSGANE